MENQLKEKIKVLSTEQPVFKNQRKTVNLVGERTLEPWQATIKHKINRHNIRLLHAVRGIIQGKSLEQIETKNKPWKQPLSAYQKQLDKLVEEYGEVVCNNQ